MRWTHGLIFILIRAATEDEQLICPAVGAAVGADATVGCHLARQRDLTSGLLQLKLKSAFVLVSRDGYVDDAMQGVQFEGRASLDQSGLSQGNFSVTISSVNETDAGTYDCIVGKGKKLSCSIELSIVDQTKDKHPGTEHHKSENDRNRCSVFGSIAICCACAVVIVVVFANRKNNQPNNPNPRLQRDRGPSGRSRR